MKICRNKITAVMVLLWGLSLTTPCFAATRGVFFGTSKFKNAHDLPACENDAVDAYRALHKHAGLDKSTRPPFRGENSKVLMKRFIQEAANGLEKGDTLIIYNASHGTETGEIYCSDGPLAPAEMAEWLKDTECSNVVIFNDSCFSAKFAERFQKEFIKRKKGVNVAQIAAANPYRVSFSSSLDSPGEEIGHRNGVFSKYFIEALDPKVSDYNKDGNVTILEMLMHIKHGMLSDEHQGIVQWMKDNDHRYQYTDQQIEDKITAWTNYYNFCAGQGDEDGKKQALRWVRHYEYIRDVKAGKEEERWQDPVAFGDLNFVVVGDTSSDWQLCMAKKVKEDPALCRIYDVEPNPATGKIESNEVFCKAQPFNLNEGEMASVDKKFGLTGLPYEAKEAKLSQLFSERANRYIALADSVSIEKMRSFASGCGDCVIQKRENREGRSDLDYTIVCRGNSGGYESNTDAFRCEGRYKSARFNQPGGKRLTDLQMEKNILSNYSRVMKALKECGYYDD